VAITGCGRKARIADEQIVVWQDSPYETLWVEPQIVLADSLMTLIRSDRIDSVLADPAPSMPQPRTAIEIRIFQPSCNPALPPGSYFLKTDYCGEIRMALVTVE